MTLYPGFISTVSGVAFILRLVPSGYGGVASDFEARGGPPGFEGLLRPYPVSAAVARALSIPTHQFKKRT